MREERFFYDPQLSGELPEEEARHAAKVLRLRQGDEIWLMNGQGAYFRAELSDVSNHRVAYCVTDECGQERAWTGHLHLAVAPTKMNERIEWLAEKATEVGFDELSFLDCQYSERRTMKTARIDRIVVSAMKQSHKAWKPVVNEMTSFDAFVTQPRKGDKFICHCYAEADIAPDETKPFLMDLLSSGNDATVLIGPEGDFSIEEVRLARQHGYRSVSLGRSRLRTETAALMAVHMMQLKNQKL